MKATVVAMAGATVLGLAIGQVLFKAAASRGGLADVLLSLPLWGGIILYGLVTVVWLLLLREIELSRAYPLVALTYILVPVMSVLLLGERVGPWYGVGVILIVVGVVLTIAS